MTGAVSAVTRAPRAPTPRVAAASHDAGAARTYPQTLPLSPTERRAYDFLAAAPQPVRWQDLLQHLYGDVDVTRRPNLVRVVANIRLALRPFRREKVLASGKNDSLCYRLTALPAPEDGAAVPPSEVARLLKRGFGIANIAEAFGMAKDAVHEIACNLDDHPPEPQPRPTAPAPAPAAARRNPPGTVTLAPCGYDEWVVRPNGVHAVQHRGEAETRILTVTDRTVNRLTTDRAPVEPHAEA